MSIDLKKHVIAVTSAFSIGLAITAPSNAQTAEGKAGAKLDLEEVIVTARRVEERLQDVPIAITVFNEAQLANSNVVNSADLANITPSLSANTNFGTENSTFAIRGFVQDNGTPPSVGVYFADVVAPRGASSGTVVGDGAGPGSFFDLQNVQVLKGPQGTLQGRNTTGGAILFVPKKPTSSLEGYAEVSAGNYDMKRVQAAINLPVSDTVRFRMAADYQNRNGYLRNNSGIGPEDLNDVNYIAARASLVVDLTPNLENYTIASYSKSDNNGTIQKMIACDPTSSFGIGFACPQVNRNNARGDDFYTVQSDLTDPHSTLTQKQVINTTTWKTTDTLTLKNIVSYAELTQDFRNALFGTDWRIPQVGAMLPFAFIQSPTGVKSADQSTITEELQLQGSADDQRLTYQGGVYFESSRPLSKIGVQSPFLIACTSPETLQCTDYLGIGASQQFGFAFPIHVGAVNYVEGETTFRNIGVYSQASYSVTDKFKVTTGYRYTWDRQQNTSKRISYTFPVLPPFTGGPTATCTDAGGPASCSQSLEASSSAPTWLIDFDYKPTDDVLLYAQYKRGYRAGGVFAQAPSNYRPFEPEKLEAYETGLKSSFRGAVSGTFNFAAFYNDFSNQQLQVGFDAVPGSGQSTTTGILNAGKSKIYGAEVEASIVPVRGLTFGVNYTFLKTEIVSIAPIISTDPNFTSELHMEKGDPLVLSPKNKYTVSGAYTLPLSESIGSISVGATFIHTDSQLSNYAYIHTPAHVTNFGGNLGELAARNLLNVNLGWDSIMGLPIDVSLFGTNVTAEKYYTFVPGLTAAGFETVAIGEPRMYGARLRYRFGT